MIPGANPNATVAAAAGAVTVIAVWLVGVLSSVDIPAEVSSAFTTVLVAGMLYLGKNRATGKGKGGGTSGPGA